MHTIRHPKMAMMYKTLCAKKVILSSTIPVSRPLLQVSSESVILLKNTFKNSTINSQQKKLKEKCRLGSDQHFTFDILREMSGDKYILYQISWKAFRH